MELLTMTKEETKLEPWVDLRAVAQHLSMGYALARKMADEGQIPCKQFRSGKMTYRRFRLSQVDAALSKEAV